MTDKLIFKDVWKKNDSTAERDAIAAWTAAGILPPGVDPKDRIRELCVVAYDGDKLAAISTCEIRMVPHVRQKMAVSRGFILPDFRRGGIGHGLTNAVYESMERYALANPDLRIGGMAGIVVVKINKQEVQTVFEGMIFAGYTVNDEPIMLRWFNHFRIPGTLSSRDPNPLGALSAD
jgi:hypothetical protein